MFLRGPVELVGVKLGQGVRQLPLHTNDLEAIGFDLVRGRSAIAESLSLQDEVTKQCGQRIDVHGKRFAQRHDLHQTVCRCPRGAVNPTSQVECVRGFGRVRSGQVRGTVPRQVQSGPGETVFAGHGFRAGSVTFLPHLAAQDDAPLVRLPASTSAGTSGRPGLACGPRPSPGAAAFRRCSSRASRPRAG
jgi:hypothetical protein